MFSSYCFFLFLFGCFQLKVACILPPIPQDPENDASMEDKHCDELETLKDVSKKGYCFQAADWVNGYVDTVDTLDALIQMIGNVETAEASAPIEEETVNTKLNRIVEVMEEYVKSMKERMSLLKEENMELKARVLELEGNQNVASRTHTPVVPTNVTQQVNSQKNLVLHLGF